MQTPPFTIEAMCLVLTGKGPTGIVSKAITRYGA